MYDKVEIPKTQENLSTCSQHQPTPTDKLRMHKADPRHISATGTQVELTYGVKLILTPYHGSDHTIGEASLSDYLTRVVLVLHAYCPARGCYWIVSMFALFFGGACTYLNSGVMLWEGEGEGERLRHSICIIGVPV